ncbi:hypothetical protein [Celeribacter arenosi]|uniref:Uncharacterized protein n=1 Tax=Celeribacter arenosi TaxID=792649 RepID=A0ABP7K6C8_9RHOB
MVTCADIIGNYPHWRHFLQTVNLPSFDPPARRFVFMKNFKPDWAADFETLMANLEKEAGIDMYEDVQRKFGDIA